MEKKMEPLKERKKNIYNGGCIIIIDDHKLNSKRKKKEERINEKLLQPPLFWAVRKRQEKRKTSRLRPNNFCGALRPAAHSLLQVNGRCFYLIFLFRSSLFLYYKSCGRFYFADAFLFFSFPPANENKNRISSGPKLKVARVGKMLINYWAGY